MRLTFDDGPSEHTLPILDLLDARGMQGTFFVVGEAVEEYPEIVLEAHRRGHLIGNHSFSHPPLTSLDLDGVRSELERCTAAIVATGAPAPTLFRPPYGATSPEIWELAAALGMAQVLWHIDPRDYEQPPAEEIVRRAREAAEPWKILLLHDGRGDRSSTVEAVRLLLSDDRADS